MVQVLSIIFFSIIALSAAGSLPSVPKSELPEKLSVQILTPEKLKLYRAANPDKVFTPLEGVASRSSIRYTLGSRINGDALVAVGADNYSWSSARDLQLSLSYPNSGTGSIVTFVDVIVEQSTNSGRAYVVSGGIGSRYISIVVEAYSTSYFNYAAGIYGL